MPSRRRRAAPPIPHAGEHPHRRFHFEIAQMKVPQPLLTFPDADKSPLSIRAKALVFFDPRSHQVRDEVERTDSGSLLRQRGRSRTASFRQLLVRRDR